MGRSAKNAWQHRFPFSDHLRGDTDKRQGVMGLGFSFFLHYAYIILFLWVMG